MISIKLTTTLDGNALRRLTQPASTVDPRERRRIQRKRRRPTLGDGGPIRTDGRAARTTRTVRTSRGRLAITYTKMKTVAQVAAANEIVDRLFGPGS